MCEGVFEETACPDEQRLNCHGGEGGGDPPPRSNTNCFHSSEATRCSNLLQIDDAYANNDCYCLWPNATKWQERTGAARFTPRLKHTSFAQFNRGSTACKVWCVAVAGSYVLSRANVDTPLVLQYHPLLEFTSNQPNVNGLAMFQLCLCRGRLHSGAPPWGAQI